LEDDMTILRFDWDYLGQCIADATFAAFDYALAKARSDG
jgi:hypothetical protein